MPPISEAVALAEARLPRTDPVMAALIRRYGPCTLGRKRRQPFHVLCSSIIGQQLSTKAADTIQARVAKALDAGRAFRPSDFLDAREDTLRTCGLSRAKAKWLRALAETVDNGQLDFAALRRMDDATALATLDALPGIGPWTAEMFLIFALGHLDIFSMGDVGLRRGINQLYNKGRPLNDARTRKLTERWAPYRSVASWYLWRVSDGDVDAWT